MFEIKNMKSILIVKTCLVLTSVIKVIQKIILRLENSLPPVVFETLTNEELNKIKKSHCSVYEKQGMKYSSKFNCSYKSSN